MRPTSRLFALACILPLLGACDSGPAMSPMATYGPNPPLAKPHTSLIPVMGVPKAEGWPAGAAPTPAAGLKVAVFAARLDHPRQLLVLSNGDVLVAESRTTPHKPKGFMDWVQQEIQKRSGALGPSANRISLIRDADGDGKPELQTVLVGGLNQPFGMAVAGDQLYVGNTDAVVRYPFTVGQSRITAPPAKVIDLPHGPGHWTRNLLASADGQLLYVGVGSGSNIADQGMALEAGRAEIREISLKRGTQRTYASGLRNPNGMAWEPFSGVLWTVVNERDMLGNDLVPDYMTGLRPGAFYGWPWSYYGAHVDERVKPQNPAMVKRAIAPDYALGAHTASLGLTFDEGSTLPAPFKDGAFVGQHGSWNRKPVSGYKVVFVPFRGGKPSDFVEDVLTGFIGPNGKVRGRPVGVAIDKGGALLVADDVGNVVWRVTGR